MQRKRFAAILVMRLIALVFSLRNQKVDERALDNVEAPT
jgi:hypothetical protein